ncbi:MAG TPA: LrgB family protein [Anoxybacillus sp.]|nr:LrgB family protein [Anoxybacillus sp.]
MTHGGDMCLFQLIIQFFVILSALLVGNAIVRFFSFPFSGSIVGMVLLLVVLGTGLVFVCFGGAWRNTFFNNLICINLRAFFLIIGPGCLERLSIKSKISKGLAMGACVQALGVGKSFQWGEEAGAIGSIGMTMCVIFHSILSMMM